MRKALLRIIPYLVIILLLIPLLAHIYLGQFIRPSSDDLCYIAKFDTLGMIGSIDWWYQNWTGVYAGIFYQNIIGALEIWQFTSMLMIVSWTVVTFFAAYQLTSLLNIRQRWLIAMLISVTIVYTVVNSLPSISQSIYWTSGSNYAVSVILLTLNLGILLHALRQDGISIPHLVLISILSFTAGGISPLFSLTQVAAFFLLLVVGGLFAPITLKRKLIVYAGMALMIAFIALLILFISPGNTIRRERFNLSLTFIDIVLSTAAISALYIPASIILFMRLETLIPLSMGIVIGAFYQPLTEQQQTVFFKTYQRWLIATLVIAFLLFYAAFFVSIVSIELIPPLRAYVVTQAVLVVALLAIGYFTGIRFKPQLVAMPENNRRTAFLIGSAILLVSVVTTTQKPLSNINGFKTFASEWHARDAMVKAAVAAGETRLTLAPLSVDIVDYMGLESTADNPNCFKEYYQLEHVEITG